MDYGQLQILSLPVLRSWINFPSPGILAGSVMTFTNATWSKWHCTRSKPNLKEDWQLPLPPSCKLHLWDPCNEDHVMSPASHMEKLCWESIWRQVSFQQFAFSWWLTKLDTSFHLDIICEVYVQVCHFFLLAYLSHILLLCSFLSITGKSFSPIHSPNLLEVLSF